MPAQPVPCQCLGDCDQSCWNRSYCTDAGAHAAYKYPRNLPHVPRTIWNRPDAECRPSYDNRIPDPYQRFTTRAEFSWFITQFADADHEHVFATMAPGGAPAMPEQPPCPDAGAGGTVVGTGVPTCARWPDGRYTRGIRPGTAAGRANACSARTTGARRRRSNVVDVVLVDVAAAVVTGVSARPTRPTLTVGGSATSPQAVTTARENAPKTSAARRRRVPLLGCCCNTRVPPYRERGALRRSGRGVHPLAGSGRCSTRTGRRCSARRRR